MADRKVVQFATLPESPTVFAICDDGTAWALEAGGTRWVQVRTNSDKEAAQ